MIDVNPSSNSAGWRHHHNQCSHWEKGSDHTGTAAAAAKLRGGDLLKVSRCLTLFSWRYGRRLSAQGPKRSPTKTARIGD
jgi:hypothetical protein